LTLLPFKNGSGAAMSSSPWEEALGEGDGDVAAPVWDGELGRGGDVLSAVGKEALGEGDGDVAAPVGDVELGRGGDVFIAVGRGFGKGRRGRRHPGLGCGTGTGRRWTHGRGERLWERATRTSPPRFGMGNWDGEAMGSSPWEEALGEGDEDVATPFHVGAPGLWTGLHFDPGW
jgi:hypothetical protein